MITIAGDPLEKYILNKLMHEQKLAKWIESEARYLISINYESDFKIDGIPIEITEYDYAKYLAKEEGGNMKLKDLFKTEEPIMLLEPWEPAKQQKYASIINSCLKLGVKIPSEFVSEYNKAIDIETPNIGAATPQKR